MQFVLTPTSYILLQAEIEARPLLYNNFMTVTADDTPVYNVVPGYEQLRKTLNDKLAEYNESNAVMDLVLFQQAMEHICRITRIISLPRGNAMLVGVGGSGKQSLARYALCFETSFCSFNAKEGSYGSFQKYKLPEIWYCLPDAYIAVSRLKSTQLHILQYFKASVCLSSWSMQVLEH